jgi:RNA polymerase sigma-70 factor (ECF subfamily)
MKSEEFQKEYQRVNDRLYTFLLRATRNPDEARELLQEAVLKGYQGRHGFRKEADFSTWLYRIAMNVWKNRLKRSAREQDYLKYMRSVPLSTVFTPEDIFGWNERNKNLDRALGILEEKYRVPLLLKHLEGFTYREISVMLGIDENTARVRVYRARHAMRAILEEV